jgi:hypothetical protein
MFSTPGPVTRINERKGSIMQNFGNERMLLYSRKQAELLSPALWTLRDTGETVEVTQRTDANGNTESLWDDFVVVCAASEVHTNPVRPCRSRGMRPHDV